MIKKLNLTKDNNLDEVEMIKLISKLFQNETADWMPILKTIIPSCQTKVTASLSKIEQKMQAAPFSVPKSQCNVKHGAVLICIMFGAFEVIFTSNAFI